MDVTIDFLIVGAAKSGTTSLHRYLAGHRQVFLPTAKELAYFLDPIEKERERKLVEALYSGVRPGQKVGLSEANMLLFPHVPERIHQHNPRARVIAVLRNPIDRAYSGYWFARLRGWETCETFEQALDRELRGGLSTRYERINFTYLEHGHYAEQLERFLAVLGRDRAFLLLTEDLISRREGTLKELLAWLGVTARLDGMALGRRHNVMTRQRFPRTGRWLFTASAPARWVLRISILRHLSGGAREWIRHHLVRPLRQLNRVPANTPPMSSETRERLRQYYRIHNRRLSDLLGRNLDHWL